MKFEIEVHRYDKHPDPSEVESSFILICPEPSRRTHFWDMAYLKWTDDGEWQWLWMCNHLPVDLRHAIDSKALWMVSPGEWVDWACLGESDEVVTE